MAVTASEVVEQVAQEIRDGAALIPSLDGTEVMVFRQLGYAGIDLVVVQLYPKNNDGNAGGPPGDP